MNDAILAAEEHVPMYKEMIESFEVEYIAGGATQNTIRVCQWMSGQAGSTAYIGCVGNDDFGSKLQTSAENDGVQVAYLKDETIPTGMLSFKRASASNNRSKCSIACNRLSFAFQAHVLC